MKPSQGRIVLIHTTQPHNGLSVHPAIITQVWSNNDPAEAKGAYACVNVKVLPDCAPPYDETSVSLYETEEEAKAAGDSMRCAWWPTRN